MPIVEVTIKEFDIEGLMKSELEWASNKFATKKDAAKALQISVPTFNKYCKMFGIDWKKIQNEKGRCK